jgi:GNAT superfamily N-acetyltransferase
MDFREISDRPQDVETLRAFYEGVYVSQFPVVDERESLKNMAEYLRLKAGGWYGRNNYHVLLGFEGDHPQAGSITDYLAAANAGVIEFLTVADGLRRNGLGRRLLDATEQLLADDAAKNGRALDCIVAEMEDPFRQTAAEDSLDPFVRAAVWDRFGYRKLDFPYIQPALSDEQSAVTNLLLLVKARRPEYQRGIPSTVMKSILAEYMRWAMRIGDPERVESYRLMCRAIDRGDCVPAVSLSHYMGHDPDRPLMLSEITSEYDPDLDAVLAVYRQAFPGGPTDISPAQLRQAVVARSRNALSDYHLWAIRSGATQRIEGMASFFTFPAAGFGGYVTLSGSLRGNGRFPLLLARIEERMIRDAVGARGWYIECEPRQEALFAHLGFHAVDCAYRQPPLSDGDMKPPQAAPSLRLMYKEFGRNFEPPVVSCAAFLAAMRQIFTGVYEIERAEGNASYRVLCECADRWGGSHVRFRPSGGAIAAR